MFVSHADDHVFFSTAAAALVLHAGQKFKAKDVVPLVTSGSSFAASGHVEVTKYAPALR